MPDEKQLADRFKRTLNELKEEVRRFERSLDYTPSDEYQESNSRAAFPSYVNDIKRKIQELKQIGVSEHRINEAIVRILERVKSEILKILQNSQISETQRQISQHLDNIDKSLNFPYGERKNQIQARQIWNHELELLEQLSVAEEDLVNAQARVLEILDKLTRAAEKLD